MLYLLLLAGLAMAAPRTDYDDTYGALSDKAKFMKFTKDFGKTYEKTEEMKRFKIFLRNMRTIEAHNAKQEPYWFGVTQFADLTPDEFKNETSCFIKRRSEELRRMEEPIRAVRHGENKLASSIDWDAQGKVTAVKNQGQCGSCWAFSTTGAMETAYAIKHRTSPPSLSEQELVDCAGSPNAGCNGGSMYYAFQFAEKGLCSESSYPYQAQTLTYECSSMESRCQKQVYVDAPHMVTARSMTSLMSALNQGAVSIAIEADQTAFQFYKGGVFTGSCGTNLDHGVLAVGYGTDGGQDFWKVKNSWGPTWGEGGYIRLCRNCGMNRWSGQCGILEQPVYPTVQ